ncbi:MAG: hypothetical protein RLZ71_57 [Actinomycetota bacterium]|jgi:methionine-rich copper-binding protein CopC
MKRISAISAALAFGLFMSPTLPALAHTDVVSTAPSVDSTVDAGVVDITVTFAEDLLQSEDNAGSDIVVSTESGAIVPVTCAVVEGGVLSATAELTEDGPVTVTWRTVGDDGHALSDTFGFTVQNAAMFESAGSVIDCPSHMVAYSNVAVEKSTDISTPKKEDNTVILGFAVAIAIIFVFSLLGALRIKRQEAQSAKKKK